MMRFIPVFAAALFLSIHYGSTLYFHSSFLNDYFQPNTVSLLFLLGALGNISLFLFAPKLIQRFGKRPFLFFSLILTAASTFIFSFTITPPTIILAFIVYSSFLPMVYYCLDIFLEELSTNAKTGEIRGIYLTVFNAGIVVGPLILAILAKEGPPTKFLYLVAGLLLIPPSLLALFSFKSRLPKAHSPYHHSLRLPFGDWWRAKNIRRVTLARLMLESFFAFMVIYTPMYLHVGLGFTWSELGIIFTVMLLPFVLFEWPAGELADRIYGEKEIMSAGFFITGVSLLVMPFIGKVFWAWMAILFVSRVGASLIEAMTESYFFKHINARDTGLISIFRLTRSTGFVFGAAVGTLTLNLFSFEKIFFVVAVVVFLGLKESLFIKDTL
ncbi:MAG: MFS transporter [bacterium]|nr:MFS transporter [bacterium]